MAEPIPFHPPARDAHAEAAAHLKHAPNEHAEALLSAFDILQSLHDEGVLEIIRGGLGSRDELLQILVKAANTPESIQGLRNLLILAKLAGTIDPKLLEGVTQAVPEGLAATSTDKPVGILRLLKQLCSQDTLRAVAAVVCMLQSIGKALKSAR